MKKKIASIVLTIIMILSLAGCSFLQTADQTTEQTKTSSSTNTSSSTKSSSSSSSSKSSSTATTVTEAEVTDTRTDEERGTFAITTSDGSFTESNGVYTITSAGEYVLSGALSDGQIIISAGEDDEVTLVLSDVSISCSFGSPIYAQSAGKVKVKAEENTSSVITDARSASSTATDTGAAAIYAECDLTLTGTGTLTVVGSYNNGVHTKDDLTIKNLTLIVNAVNNALKGNDSLTIESGTITAVATDGDALKTENNDVSAKGNQRGTIEILDGTVTLSASDEAIDASYDVTISGGTVSITAGDDGIHADNNVTIDGGMVTVSAGDDGIHAEATLTINDGTVDVNAYEGLEGHVITVNGGTITVLATDDAVNATGSSSNKSDGVITINGGYLVAEVQGRDVDGIDSNGSYYQTGGVVIVSNPNADSSGNMSALDADSTVSITGGIIVALGTVPGAQGGQNNRGGFGGMGGMGSFGMGGMTSSSSLPNGYVTFSGTLSAGTHKFTYNGTSYTFTLKSSVSSGWIWASGISSTNYSLQ